MDDGSITFVGGQNGDLESSEIGADQYRRGLNVTTAKGNLSPRPGFIHRPIIVSTQGKISALSYQQIFDKGKFQAACAYDAEDGEYILAVFSGIIFRINPKIETAEVINLGDADDRMDQYRRRIPWSHAGRFVVFFDYPNLPVILENKTARRANPHRESLPGVPLPEIITSVLGAFIQSRLWIASEFNEFTAGDPVGPSFPDAPITFEEVFGLAAPFATQASFSLGSQSSHQSITAMGLMQAPDSSTGAGPLVVGTALATYLYRADLPRDQWEQTAFGKCFLYNAGPGGPRCIVNVNSDLMLMCNDNQFRSLLLSRSQEDKWSNAPISREIKNWLEEFKRPEFIDIAFCSSYDNRVFVSIAPFVMEALNLDGLPVFDYAHGGMAVLELDNISGVGSDARPAWAGCWTGIYPMEMVVTKNGPFIFSKDSGGTNRLYFLDKEKTWDEFEGQQKNIVCRVEFKSYDFNSPFNDKKLKEAVWDIGEIEGEFKIQVDYKSANSKNWSLWRNFEHNAVTTLESFDSADEMPVYDGQNFRDLSFGDPQEVECDPLTGDQGDTFRALDLRMTVEAHRWKLSGLKLAADVVMKSQATVRECDKKTVKVPMEFEPVDWEIYHTATKGPAWL